MSIFFQKLHTALKLFEHPRFFKEYARGIVPETYFNLDNPWFRSMAFDTVLDIGANIGRFAITINSLFPKAQIIAFEPLPSCFKKAEKIISNYSGSQALNIGLGSKNETLEIFENDFSPSSSFLPMADMHIDAFPFTDKQTSTSVEVKALDTVAEELALGDRILVKIDVQGYERDVIAGGKRTLSQAKAILIELSYHELYQGQALFDEIFDEMKAMGFRFAGTLAQMPHPKDGRLLDADCLFIKGQ
ncbi:MAG: FkbM family methyltransferase [Parasphingorhabdus sp.]